MVLRQGSSGGKKPSPQEIIWKDIKRASGMAEPRVLSVVTWTGSFSGQAQAHVASSAPVGKTEKEGHGMPYRAGGRMTQVTVHRSTDMWLEDSPCPAHLEPTTEASSSRNQAWKQGLNQGHKTWGDGVSQR